jgi:hypothetical protein
MILILNRSNLMGNHTHVFMVGRLIFYCTQMKITSFFIYYFSLRYYEDSLLESIVFIWFLMKNDLHKWPFDAEEKNKKKSSVDQGQTGIKRPPCDIPYKKYKRPPKFLQNAIIFTFWIGNWKGHCDQRRLATIASPPLVLTKFQNEQLMVYAPNTSWV